MKKLDSILIKSKEIDDFKLYDLESEWTDFTKSADLVQHETLQKSINSKGDQKNSLAGYIKYILSAAAGIILLVAMMLMFRQPKADTAILTTTINRDSIELIDGSTVVLYPHSSLKYFLSLQEKNVRTLYFEGKGQFDIARSILPLKVYNKDLVIDILGTQFDIVNHVDYTEIKNTEGSVKVSEVKNNLNFRILKEGDIFHYKNGIFTTPSDTFSLSTKNQVEPGSPIKSKEAQQQPKSKKIKGSKYTLKAVVKNYLLKYHKKEIKLEKRTKLDLDAIVLIDDLNKPVKSILEDLKTQGFIDYKPGNCTDCYIIMSPVKNK